MLYIVRDPKSGVELTCLSCCKRRQAATSQRPFRPIRWGKHAIGEFLQEVVHACEASADRELLAYIDTALAAPDSYAAFYSFQVGSMIDCIAQA